MTDRGRLETAEKMQMLQLKHIFLVGDVCTRHVAVVHGRLLQLLFVYTSLRVDEITTSRQLRLLHSRQSRFLQPASRALTTEGSQHSHCKPFYKDSISYTIRTYRPMKLQRVNNYETTTRRQRVMHVTYLLSSSFV